MVYDTKNSQYLLFTQSGLGSLWFLMSDLKFHCRNVYPIFWIQLGIGAPITVLVVIVARPILYISSNPVDNATIERRHRSAFIVCLIVISCPAAAGALASLNDSSRNTIRCSLIILVHIYSCRSALCWCCTYKCRLHWWAPSTGISSEAGGWRRTTTFTVSKGSGWRRRRGRGWWWGRSCSRLFSFSPPEM